MRNMHAPAYCPVVLGVNADDQRGVLVEVKKTISMDCMLMDIEVDEAIAMEVDAAMDMEPVVEVDISIVDDNIC